MGWLFELHKTQPVAHAIGLLALVCVFGMALGSVKFRGVGLGTSGVLFAGIIAGHLGEEVDHGILDFVKEFGLILFVFTIGLQLGPGFFAALRQQGIKLNVIALVIVAMGALLAPLMGMLFGFDPAAVLGIFSGASTNTPSLGAGAQALSSIHGIAPERLDLPALAYSVTYPAAIASIIGALLLLKQILRIDPRAEAEAFNAKRRRPEARIERRTLRVTNPNLVGLRLADLPGRLESGITFARLSRDGKVTPALDEAKIEMGDLLSAVGAPAGLEAFQRVVGEAEEENRDLINDELMDQNVAVTSRAVLGKTVDELGLGARFDVAVTRITRADLEMTAVPAISLKYGDIVRIVGRPADIEKAARHLGNAIAELKETHFIPFFIGIALGVALGTLPIPIPGFPQPVRLGLAGGPLIVALILGRIGRIRRQVWHMPANTNLAFREFGIALFFAAVGLSAGKRFVATVFSATGMEWLAAGVCVTVVPIVLAGLFSRLVLKMNFLDICGMLAGSLTDPPALAFASNIARSDAPATAYATVYPLTMLLRILSAQLLAITLFQR